MAADITPSGRARHGNHLIRIMWPLRLSLKTPDGLIRLKPKRSVHLNISRKERQTLIDPCNREDNIVKRADKWSVTVVEDRQTYIAKCLEHVQNTDVYQLEGNPSLHIVSDINALVRRIYDLGLFDKHTVKFITKMPREVRTQQLYFPNKIHKNPPAYRPIVSGSDGPTKAISKFWVSS